MNDPVSGKALACFYIGLCRSDPVLRLLSGAGMRSAGGTIILLRILLFYTFCTVQSRTHSVGFSGRFWAFPFPFASIRWFCLPSLPYHYNRLLFSCQALQANFFAQFQTFFAALKSAFQGENERMFRLI